MPFEPTVVIKGIADTVHGSSRVCNGLRAEVVAPPVVAMTWTLWMSGLGQSA